MKTKCVYVLVSTPQDYYYEQTLISAWSVRHWNPDAEILLLTDELTDATLKDARTRLLEVVNGKIVIDLSEGGTSRYTGKERSRMLKTNMRSYVMGDMLYIDSDTVICSSLAEIDSWQCKIGAVSDGHRVFNPKVTYDVVQRAEILGYDVTGAKEYYNSGVIYMKDLPEVHKFMSDWHSVYMRGQKLGLSYDQPSLLAVSMQSEMISPLDGTYNCQILNGGLPYWADAKIIHAYNAFGNSPFFALTDPVFYQKIKQQGTLRDEEVTKILSAKRQFIGEYALVYGGNLSYWHSVLRHLFIDSPKSFRLCEWLGKILVKLSK